jgi:hypothetical protein
MSKNTTTTKSAQSTTSEAPVYKTEAQVLAILKRSKKGRTLNELGTTYYRMLKMQSEGLTKPVGERRIENRRGRPAVEFGVTDKGRAYVAPKPTKAKPVSATKTASPKKGAKPGVKGAKGKATTTRKPKAKPVASKATAKPDVATTNVKAARASQVRSTRSLADVNAAKAGKPAAAETRMPSPVNA